MRVVFMMILLLGLACVTHSQIITVRNHITHEPVEMATLSSETPRVFVTTNSKGKADISAFKNADSIVFRHLNYREAVYSYKQLLAMRYVVEMTGVMFPLPEVSISPDRWEESKLEAPNRIERIKVREIAFQNPQTTADLLGISGYAFIQKSQMGGGSPMLRGFATNRVLLIIDGVRMNTAIFRAGNLQNVISLDANAMENTEIIFGPSAVMYGSDAIGGVMAFQTIEPRFSGPEDKNLIASGNAFMRTSSANSEKTEHFDINIGLKKLAFVSSFTSSEYGDLRSGSVGGVRYFYRPYYVQTIDNKDYMVPNPDSSLQIGSKYSQINFMQKVRYKPGLFWDLNYGFHFSETSKFNRYDRLYVMQTSGPYKNKLRWAEWFYGPQKWNMHRVGITNSYSNIFYDEMRLVGALQFFEESRYDREFMVRELRMQKEQLSAISLNIDFDKKLNDKLSISYGFEKVFNKVHSIAALAHVVTGQLDSTVTRYPDGSTWESDGLYVSFNYHANEKLSFTGGSRYSYYKIKADFDTTFFPFPFQQTVMSNDAINGSLGMVYSPLRSWQIYFNAASGYRAPNIDDMGKVFESTPGFLVVPNPDLKPEKVYNLELGMLKTFGNFLKFDFAAYYTLLKDGMVRKNFTFNGDTTIRYLGNKSRIQAVQNVTRIQVYGLQAGIDFFYKGWGLKSNISYQNGKEQSPDSLVYYPLRHAAPTFGSTHLTYEHKKVMLDFYAVYNAKMDFEDLALTERLNASYARDEKGNAYVDKWYTLNFKAAVNFNPFVTLSAGVENITDRLYRPYASGINAPGRNFIISLKAKF